MSDVTSFEVTGDWRHIVDDGMVDEDNLPDEVPLTGKVVFRPVYPTVATAGVPATAYTLGSVTALIAGGVLTDLQGRPGVMLAGKVGEHTVRWSAETSLRFQEQKVDYPRVTFDLTEDVRLTGIITQAGPSLTPIVVDPRIEALAASVENVNLAVTAASGYASTAAEQVPLAKGHADRAEGLAVAQDVHIAGVVEDAGSATRTALNATYAAKGFVGSTPPTQLTGVTIQDEATASGGVRPCGTLPGGVLVGYSGSTSVFLSTDNGATWTQRGTAPAGQVQRVFPTATGKHLVVTNQAVYLVTNLLSGTISWGSAKVAVNGQARFTRFCADFDPVSGKGIVSQYGPGAGQSFIDSRYAHVTLDGGETWTLAWDSVVVLGSEVASTSHVHGACYDPWEDTFYVIEGHTTDAGVYRASAASAPTPNGWLFNDGYRAYSAPTCIVATDNGLVLTSDDPKAGLWGIPRVGPQAGRSIIRTWSWRHRQDGVIGFGQHAERDPETGIVYAVYQSSFTDIPPIIVGGTATVGGLVYEYGGPLGGSQPQLQALALGAGGKLIASAFVDGRREIITGWRTGIGQSRTENRGGVDGGFAEIGSSLAVGSRSSTGSHARGMAVGVEATSVANAIAMGFRARAEATQVIAIGHEVVVAGGGSVAIGQAAESTFGSGVVIGQNAKAITGGASTAVGSASQAWTQGTAIGNNAKSLATRTTAIGWNATANTAHTGSVALGSEVTTTAGSQVHIGPRHLALEPTATEPPRPPVTGVGYLFTRLNGSGKTETCVKYRGTTTAGSVHVLATEA